MAQVNIQVMQERVKKRSVNFILLEKKIIEAFESIDRIIRKEVVVEGFLDDAVNIQLFVAIDVFLELVKQDIGVGILGECPLVIGGFKQPKDILIGSAGSYQAA